MFTCIGCGAQSASEHLRPYGHAEGCGLMVDATSPAARRGGVPTFAALRVNRTCLGGTALILLLTTALRAEEPKGCDAFKWSLKQEAAQLAAAGRQAAPTDGSALTNATAYELKLSPLAEAKLPQPPEHKPKMDPSMAGFVRFAAPPVAGAYQIAISQAAWIDVVQDGRYVRPSAFSGATDCPGVRKSIRFDLAPKPFAVQISGTTASSVAMLVEPVRP